MAVVFGSAEVKIFGEDNQLKITTKYKIQETGSAADEDVNKKLFESLKKHYSADMTYDKFVNTPFVNTFVSIAVVEVPVNFTPVNLKVPDIFLFTVSILEITI